MCAIQLCYNKWKVDSHQKTLLNSSNIKVVQGLANMITRASGQIQSFVRVLIPLKILEKLQWKVDDNFFLISYPALFGTTYKNQRCVYNHACMMRPYSMCRATWAALHQNKYSPGGIFRGIFRFFSLSLLTVASGKYYHPTGSNIEAAVIDVS